MLLCLPYATRTLKVFWLKNPFNCSLEALLFRIGESSSIAIIVFSHDNSLSSLSSKLKLSFSANNECQFSGMSFRIHLVLPIPCGPIKMSRFSLGDMALLKEESRIGSDGSGGRKTLFCLTADWANPTENQFKEMIIANPKDNNEYGVMWDFRCGDHFPINDWTLFSRFQLITNQMYFWFHLSGEQCLIIICLFIN